MQASGLGFSDCVSGLCIVGEGGEGDLQMGFLLIVSDMLVFG